MICPEDLIYAGRVYMLFYDFATIDYKKIFFQFVYNTEVKAFLVH